MKYNNTIGQFDKYETFIIRTSYASGMNEWYYLGAAIAVFLVGLTLGVLLLRRSLREQRDYEDRLRSLAAPASAPAEGPAPPVPIVSQAPAQVAPGAPVAPVPPAAPVGGGVTEAEAKAKVESTKTLIEQFKSEGVDVSQADKLLQLATSTLYSGDYERAAKYAAKATKVATESKEKVPGAAPAAAAAPAVVAGAPTQPVAPAAPAAAPAAPTASESEDAQQKEVVALIGAVQAKLANVTGESVEKSEVENLLRLATSFVRSKSFPKALRYAKQAEEKAATLVK